jgi:hypothetical protein
MSYLSNEELQAKFQAADSEVTVGAQYYHYKKPNFDPYTVHGIVFIEQTQESAVLYSPTGGGGVQWVRTTKNFLEEVNVDGTKVKRFKKAE